MTPPINVADDAAPRNPQNRGDHDNGKNDIVLEEFEETIDVDVFYYIPKSFHDVMHSPLADPAVADT